MKYTVTTLLLLLHLSSNAQNNHKIVLNDTTFYERENEISARQHATFYKIVSADGDKFAVKEYYMENDQLRTTGHYSDMDSMKKEGQFVQYFKSGRLLSRGSYSNGKRTGLWENFADTMTAPLWYSSQYVDGNMQGELKSYYYLTGKLKRTEIHEHMEFPQPTPKKSKVTLANKVVDSITSGTCYDEQGNTIPFTRFEIMPKPAFDMAQYLSTNLHYPDEARENNKEGRVIVNFYIDEDGTLSDVRVIRHVCPDIDAEAERVVLNMPRWKAGIRDDQPARVNFNLPLVFRLE